MQMGTWRLLWAEGRSRRTQQTFSPPIIQSQPGRTPLHLPCAHLATARSQPGLPREAGSKGRAAEQVLLVEGQGQPTG